MYIKISKANLKLKMQKPWHETLLKKNFYQKYFQSDHARCYYCRISKAQSDGYFWKSDTAKKHVMKQTHSKFTICSCLDTTIMKLLLSIQQNKVVYLSYLLLCAILLTIILLLIFSNPKTSNFLSFALLFRNTVVHKP